MKELLWGFSFQKKPRHSGTWDTDKGVPCRQSTQGHMCPACRRSWCVPHSSVLSAVKLWSCCCILSWCWKTDQERVRINGSCLLFLCSPSLWQQERKEGVNWQWQSNTWLCCELKWMRQQLRSLQLFPLHSVDMSNQTKLTSSECLTYLVCFRQPYSNRHYVPLCAAFLTPSSKPIYPRWSLWWGNIFLCCS